MKSLQYSSFGEPRHVVAPADVESASPQAGEVRLRIVASPIHNHDLATIRGLYGIKPALPAHPGSEALGIVDALGEGATHLRVGQRVSVTSIRGAWAEFAVVPALGCVPIPDALDDDAACQLLAMPLSALVLLEELHLPDGAWVMQTAAGGAVGRILETVARHRGVSVLNLVRRNDAIASLKTQGVRQVVATDDPHWSDRVRAIIGEGKLLRVVDSVGGSLSLALMQLLDDGGEFISFGALSGAPLSIDPGGLLFRQLVVRGFWMARWLSQASPERRIALITELLQLVLSGTVELTVDARYSLENAREAFDHAERPGRHGKIIFCP